MSTIDEIIKMLVSDEYLILEKLEQLRPYVELGEFVIQYEHLLDWHINVTVPTYDKLEQLIQQINELEIK